MATPTELQAVLEQLLVPNSDVIDKATKRLKELYVDKDFVAALFNLLGTSGSPQVRQYAAVLLRRKVSKAAQWSRLPPDVQKGLKENVLALLAREAENGVRNSIAQIIGAVARQDMPNWPQLLQFLEQYTRSANSLERQVSMLVLKTVSAEAAEQLQPHLPSVLALCGQTLNDGENQLVPFYSIQVLNNIVFLVSSSEQAQCSALIPQVLTVLKKIANYDEEQACEAMEIFDTLAECEVGILAPHVKSIVDFCLELAADSQNKGDPIRVKALAIISWIVSLKKKAILKLNLIQPIMDIVYSIMCRHGEGEEDEDDSDSEETQKAATYAAKIMDTLALHLPPEKIVKHVMQRSDAALQSVRPNDRKAGYIALGVIAEGCSEYITQNHMETFLQCGLNGLKDPHVTVRNSAMFAIGQFADYLQPNITKYANQVLPCLLDYAAAASKAAKSYVTSMRAYFALEAFVENLGKDIVPYLPTLMEHLLGLLALPDGSSEVNIKLKEFSLSCIGAIAVAGKTDMAPYLLPVMEYLKVYLSQTDGKEMHHIQLQALDTLSNLAREVGIETFAPLVSECIALGYHLLDSYQDPDVRRCVYCLFGSLATLKTNDMKGYVDKIATILIESVKSTEGLQAHFVDEDEKIFESFLELETSDQNGDALDEADVKGFSIENAYVEEKEAAINAIAEFATHYSEAYIPHLEESFNVVSSAFDIDVSDIQQSCAHTLTCIACALHDVASQSITGSPAGFSQQLGAGLGVILKQLVPRLLLMVKDEKERIVVMTALNSIQELLERIGLPVLHEGAQTAVHIVACVRDVFKSRTACQDQDDEEAAAGAGGDDGSEEAEYDTLLVENAGSVLPPLAKITGMTFVPFLTELLPDLMKRTKASCSVAERSFSIGTLGEILYEMGDGAGTSFASQLYPVFQRGIKDADDEVRNNAVYSMGVLAAHSGASLLHKYSELSAALLSLLDKETHAYVIDNICGALARLISRACNTPNPQSLVPIREIYPKLLSHLPLKEDFNENETVYDCIAGPLYRCSKAHVLDNLPQLLQVLTAVLPTDNLKADTKEKLAAMLTDIRSAEPHALQGAMAGVPPVSVLWKLFPAGL